MSPQLIIGLLGAGIVFAAALTGAFIGGLHLIISIAAGCA